MAATLPFIQTCCRTCDDPTVINIPGPGPEYGTGSPEGVVQAYPGTTYWDTDGQSMWIKNSGDNTNTGWVQLIA